MSTRRVLFTCCSLQIRASRSCLPHRGARRHTEHRFSPEMENNCVSVSTLFSHTFRCPPATTRSTARRNTAKGSFRQDSDDRPVRGGSQVQGTYLGTLTKSKSGLPAISASSFHTDGSTCGTLQEGRCTSRYPSSNPSQPHSSSRARRCTGDEVGSPGAGRSGIPSGGESR